MRKLIQDELFFLAFVCAEQDRFALVDAWPKGTPERAKAQSEYDQLRAYRLKRWGKTKLEAMEAVATPVKIRFSP